MDLLKTSQGDGDLGSHVEGEMNVGGISSTKSDAPDAEFNTLDEPILQTIVMIHFMYFKFNYFIL